MDHQDWQPLVLRKTGPVATKTAHEIAQAKAKNQLETVAKKDLSSSSSAKQIRDLDNNERDDFKMQSTSLEFRHALAQARQAKGWAQKELAAQLNIPVSNVANYENGKEHPSGNIVNTLNRLLNTKLPKR